MNFDELKNEWDKEPTENIKLPKSVDQLQGKQSPIAKIQKNMRSELIAQLVVIILMGVLPDYYGLDLVLQLPYYLLYILLLGLTAYFFIRFYLFYDKIGKMELSTIEHLYQAYYDIKLNIEVYKTFTYMLIPNAVIFGMILRAGIYYEYHQMAFSAGNILGFSFWTYIFAFIAFLLIVYFATEWWVKRNYARYMRQVEQVILDLR